MSQSQVSFPRYSTIILLGIILAFFAFQNAVSSNIRRSDPGNALLRTPGDAGALARLIDREIRSEGKYIPRTQYERSARLSLITQPLAGKSLRIIGMNAEANGDLAQAEQAMRLSHRVSRRDALTQIWLIENAAQKDDFSAIAEHYNAAMSVRPELISTMQPILVDGLRYKEVRDAITPFIIRKARWMPSFLSSATRNAGTEDISDLITPVAAYLAGPEYEKVIAQLMYRLAADGDWDEAVALASRTWGDFDTQKFADFNPRIENTGGREGPLSWELTKTGGIFAELSGSIDGIEIELQPLSRGAVLTRAIRADGGGRYIFSQRVNFKSESRTSMTWNGACPSEEEGLKLIWSQQLPPANQPKTYRMEINIPSDCPLLILWLAANGPDGQMPSYASISDMSWQYIDRQR